MVVHRVCMVSLRCLDLAAEPALAIAAAVYLSWYSGPRGRVCRPHAASQAPEKSVALRRWDRMRPFGRWSYTLHGTLPRGANPAQGNPNSMPHIRARSKSLHDLLSVGAAASFRTPDQGNP